MQLNSCFLSLLAVYIKLACTSRSIYVARLPLAVSTVLQFISLTFWCPLLPYGYGYKASCAGPG